MNDLPKTIECSGKVVTLRRFRADDLDAMLKFARSLPEHDLLFLDRDLKHRKVVDAWLAEIEDGFIDSLIAEAPSGVVGTSALVRDPLGWSTHVGELRLLVSPKLRGVGLGRAMLEESFRMALQRDLRKLIARMTPDQTAAIALFEDLGFVREALLADHVMGRDGVTHDLIVLSQTVERAAARLVA
ncbi:GNAT family N-acetyltransferase [Sphingomonas sp. LaA6.9]|uniref:GNAT family N-acetyltransferase n=1 Tax=Sphingomonas sp. LaA6.9 TaxID=2919914 RepID=UPI001F4F327D|nr:GNAT family N-acetyltransferase [Sphingomonas sp. LaA6.9]MCJ8156562.1 GNAT family N-acetyltransferase [Sphingomonas sp. LaA6.9]